jgi:hypothetical protein
MITPTPQPLNDEDEQLIKSYQSFHFQPPFLLALAAIMYRHPTTVLDYWKIDKVSIIESAD